jgi:WD40 repeat protein
MGAHYRSLQFKSENREAVAASAESLIKEHDGRMLVGPCINGWIGLYPDDAASSETLAAKISESLKVYALDLSVHDSDIFFYNFYLNGRLIDEYSSSPDYFEKVSSTEHERLKGKPEVFRELLGSNDKLAELQGLLAANRKDGFTFEEARLEKLASLLGIKNTSASYDYLTNGEWDGIKGRKQFVHVPDLTVEKTAAKMAAAAVRTEIKRLKKEGVLCFEALPSPKDKLAHSEPAWDPINGGVLYSWTRYSVIPRKSGFFCVSPPWKSQVEMPEFQMTNAPQDLLFSRTGKWFAYSDGQLRLWDWRERKMLDINIQNSSPKQFSHDEKLLLCRNDQGFVIVSMETREALKTISIENRSTQFLAWHPAGRFIVIQSRLDQIGLLDLETGKVAKVLYLGTITDWSELFAMFSDAVPKTGLSKEQLDEMRQGFIKGSNAAFTMKFSSDGRLLFSATNRGLNVLEWDKVLNAEKSTPPPLLVTSPVPLQPPMSLAGEEYLNYIYDVVFDEEQKRLLFAGIEGVIRFLDLTDGSTGVLLQPPQTNNIRRLHLSPDREFICCYCTPPYDDRNKKPNRIQIWNYRLLRSAVGLD